MSLHLHFHYIYNSANLYILLNNVFNDITLKFFYNPIAVFNNYSHLHLHKQNNIQSKPSDHPQSKKLHVFIKSDGYKHPKQSITVE